MTSCSRLSISQFGTPQFGHPSGSRRDTPTVIRRQRPAALSIGCCLSGEGVSLMQLSVMSWRDARHLAEEAGEVRRVGVADRVGDVDDPHVGFGKHARCLAVARLP